QKGISSAKFNNQEKHGKAKNQLQSVNVSRAGLSACLFASGISSSRLEKCELSGAHLRVVSVYVLSLVTSTSDFANSVITVGQHTVSLMTVTGKPRGILYTRPATPRLQPQQWVSLCGFRREGNDQMTETNKLRSSAARKQSTCHVSITWRASGAVTHAVPCRQHPPPPAISRHQTGDTTTPLMKPGLPDADACFFIAPLPSPLPLEGDVKADTTSGVFTSRRTPSQQREG
ncbi:unnamed protein product, partial [Cyprideis torosa]